MKFTLITYNICHGKYLNRALTFVKDEEPAIACFQEMGTTGQDFEANKINLFGEFKQKLGRDGIYERMFWGDTGQGRYDLGVAILTRFKILDSVVYYYEREQTEQAIEPGVTDRYFLPRVLLGVKMQLGLKELWVLTTHFTITPAITPTPHQIKNAHTVKQWLNNFDEYIFCGDLNAGYATETYEIFKLGSKDVSKPELPTLHPTLHPVGHLRPHVDYVFIKSNTLQAVSSRVPVVDGSDHLPVVVEFELINK